MNQQLQKQSIYRLNMDLFKKWLNHIQVYQRCTFSKSWIGTYTWSYIANHILLVEHRGSLPSWNGMGCAFRSYILYIYIYIYIFKAWPIIPHVTNQDANYDEPTHGWVNFTFNFLLISPWLQTNLYLIPYHIPEKTYAVTHIPKISFYT